MELHFRFAKEEDIKELVEVCNGCFDEHTEYENARESFLKSQNDFNQLYLIGLLDGKIVAHTKITMVPTIFENMGTFAILNHVCVLPEFRRHHIADYMMQVIKKICKQRGCSTIKLWSCNFRVPAHKCYLKNGFEVLDAKFFEFDCEE